MGIQYRILIPFSVLLVVLVSVLGYTSVLIISENIEEQMRSQLETLTRLLSRSGISLGRQTLDRIGEFLDAGVVTLDADRSIIASSIDRETAAVLVMHIRGVAEDAVHQLSCKRVMVGEKEWIVSYSPLRRGRIRGVLLAFDAERLAAAKRRAVMPLLIFAVAAIILTNIVALLIAGSITRPIRRLTETAEKLASGNFDVDVQTDAGGEVGRLAEGFARMLRGLKEARRELLAKERLATLGRLAATVAHEIRNPLTSISLGCQLLREATDEPEKLAVIDRIRTEIELLRLTTESLLSLGRPTRPVIREVQLAEPVSEAIALLSTQFAHLGIVVENGMGNSIPAALADSAGLKQAIMNLLLNAAEAQPNGGKVTITAAVDDNSASLSISDEGGGIQDEAADRMFEPFFSTKESGCGLGLAVTKQLVEAMQGNIMFTLDPTTFTISLPRARSILDKSHQ